MSKKNRFRSKFPKSLVGVLLNLLSRIFPSYYCLYQNWKTITTLSEQFQNTTLSEQFQNPMENFVIAQAKLTLLTHDPVPHLD
jgi:hypothetical protein